MGPYKFDKPIEDVGDVVYRDVEILENGARYKGEWSREKNQR